MQNKHQQWMVLLSSLKINISSQIWLTTIAAPTKMIKPVFKSILLFIRHDIPMPQ